MEGVSGVKSVQIDFEARTATVTFDPAATTAEAIAASATNAGYPTSILS
ncbi:MAG: cation transporter [Dongiaceae bacterium]